MARRVVVCGGREYADKNRVRSTLAWLAAGGGELPVIVHGAARGADRLVAAEAERFGFPTEAHPADWARYGRGAGVIRNRAMLDAGADLVVAFPGGSGTADCVAEARRRGVRAIEV